MGVGIVGARMPLRWRAGNEGAFIRRSTLQAQRDRRAAHPSRNAHFVRSWWRRRAARPNGRRVCRRKRHRSCIPRSARRPSAPSRTRHLCSPPCRAVPHLAPPVHVVLPYTHTPCTMCTALATTFLRGLLYTCRFVGSALPRFVAPRASHQPAERVALPRM